MDPLLRLEHMLSECSLRSQDEPDHETTSTRLIVQF